MLTVVNLSKSFEKVKAVKNIAFSVKKGQLFALLGTNGAGKSTVIHMLMNLLSKDKGTIQFHSDNMIGVVFQSNRLDEELTIEENISLRAKLYGMKRAEIQKKLNTLLKLTNLSSKCNRKYGTCSGGERRKVDIIRALIHSPTFLILDEPTTGLDAESREDIWRLLHRLQKDQNLTILLTTHYIEEAEDADYVLIMHDGEIKIEGTTSQLKTKYSNIKLKIQTKQPKETLHLLSKHHVSFELVNNNIFIPLQNSIEAIPLLNLIKDKITSFSIEEASLESVFLQITEHIKNEVNV